MSCCDVTPPHSRTSSPSPAFRQACRRRSSHSSGRSPSIPHKFDSPSSSPVRDGQSYQQKKSTIRWVINNPDPDPDTLKQLAISCGGLLTNEIRKKAWPRLLNIDINNITPKPSTEILHGHRDYQQVLLDVKRSLKRFPPGMEEMKRMSLQDQMVDVILRVLVAHDELHYYQGYHDICVTFLLVVGEDLTFAIMDKLSQDHLRDFMYKTMERTDGMLNYLYPIIGKASPDLQQHMNKAEVGTIFCLSWLITWYGHTLADFSSIVRLYDYFIACHPIMPIYLAAAIVLHRKEEVLSAECEMPVIHSLLSHIPESLPYEYLMQCAGDLYIQFPPSSLQDEIEKQMREKKILEELLRKNQLKIREQYYKTKRERSSALTKLKKGSNIFVKVTVWTLAAAVTAAAYTVFTSSTGWHLWGS